MKKNINIKRSKIKLNTIELKHIDYKNIPFTVYDENGNISELKPNTTYKCVIIENLNP